MRNLTLSIALLLLPPMAASAQAPPAGAQGKAKDVVREKDPKKAIDAEARLRVSETSLDSLLAQALKNNPDIRVAESKLREAEAELNRVRLQVSQKLVAQQREIAVSKAAIQQVEAEYARIRALIKTGAASREMLNSVEARLQQVKAELARLEADLPYLLGTPPRAAQSLLTEANKRWSHAATMLEAYIAVDREAAALKSAQKAKTTDAKSARQAQDRQIEQARIRGLEEAFRLQLDELVLKEQTLALGLETRYRILPQGMADKIRKALDTPVKLEFTQASPKDILDYLRDRTNGFNLVDQAHVDKASNIDLRLTEPVPVGAVFQLLEDQFGWRFVVREYGIVVTQAGRVPPGAVSLQEFWKERPGRAPATKSKSDKK